MKLSIASDHAGFALKEKILQVLTQNEVDWLDLGTHGEDSVDYPDFGIKAAQSVSEGSRERAILVCGTGIGMSIVANKFPGVRAALCHNLETTLASRQHNDANILVLGGRVIEEGLALSIVKTWLDTPFEGGRHQRRLDKIAALET